MTDDRHQQTAAEVLIVAGLNRHADAEEAIAAALAAAEQRGHDRLARRMLALAEDLDKPMHGLPEGSMAFVPYRLTAARIRAAVASALDRGTE